MGGRATSHRHPTRSSAPRSGANRLILPLSAAFLLIVLVWAFWPSPLANVANLDSRGTTIIAFGDSITSGVGAADGEDYPSRLSALIGAPVINAGVSGDTTDSALARLDRDVLSRDPRIVIVGLGGNDFLRGAPVASTEANLRTIVSRIRESGAMVVLLGYRFPTFGARYEDMYKRVASDERALLVPDLLDGILSKPALRSDPIHPNGAGYAIMAERVAGPLRKLLRAAG